MLLSEYYACKDNFIRNPEKVETFFQGKVDGQLMYCYLYYVICYSILVYHFKHF